jgi:hypothetical protein
VRLQRAFALLLHNYQSVDKKKGTIISVLLYTETNSCVRNTANLGLRHLSLVLKVRYFLGNVAESNNER